MDERALAAGPGGRAGPMRGRPSISGSDTYVTLTLAGQLCGVPVMAVRDVLADQVVARIPLAPPDVAGNLNLRGRIVTAIDLRARLRLPARQVGECRMSLVTEQGSELYALQVDQVSEVVTLDPASIAPNPPTLPANWAEYCLGIHRAEDRLMMLLDVEALLRIDASLAA